jgi:hypothetical protein
MMAMRNPEQPKTVLDTIAMLTGTTPTPTSAANYMIICHLPTIRPTKNVSFN